MTTAKYKIGDSFYLKQDYKMFKKGEEVHFTQDRFCHETGIERCVCLGKNRFGKNDFKMVFIPFSVLILPNQSPKERDGMFCPYCNKEAEFLSSRAFYGTDYGSNVYVCRPCDAYVGTQKNSKKALGTMAKADLRKLRKEAHFHFDLLWKKRKMSRGRAYVWLQEKMNLSSKDAHIGMFNEEQCVKLINMLQEKSHK